MKCCVQLYNLSKLWYNFINVCLYIGTFNAGTHNYHHCLLSSNLGTILLGEEGVSYNIMYAYILDNFNFNSDFNFNSKCSHM